MGDHTHDGYAPIDHVHEGYAKQDDLDLLEDVVATKADSTHSHSEYASVRHLHEDYATQISLDTLREDVDSKADANHGHSEYSSVAHSHAEYAMSSHAHSNYAETSHSHDDYATVNALNEVSSVISSKANISHSHNDLYYTETEIDSKLASKSDSSHNHTGVYEVNGAAANALVSAKAYTDSKIDALVGDGASATLDTIGEISTAIESNQDAIDLLNSAIGNKANSNDLSSHVGDTTKHVTSTERTNWNAAKSHADAAHAPSNAEKNQNAFSSVIVGSTTIAADTVTDTLTLVAGSNITLTPDATNDKITIAAKDTVYTHPATSGNKHIPSGGSAGQVLKWSADGVAAWGDDKDTTYSAAGTSLGLVKTGGDVTINDGVISVNDDSHAHIIGNIDGLQSALDGKAATSHGTHVSFSSTTPKVAGTASVGSATTVSRSDHVHPAQTSVSGNAGTATKLKTARTVDGVNFDGSVAITNYGTCSTDAGTVAKTVALTDFSLVTGARICVKFTVTNTASSPTLNVNNTSAKAIVYRGSAISAGYLAANRVYEFVYDGTDWELIGDVNIDTKNTAGSTNSSSKLFLVGATSQAANPQTYSHDTAYVGTDGHLYSNNKQTVNLSDSQALTNKTYNGYTLGAACAKGVATSVASGNTNLVTSGAVYSALEIDYDTLLKFDTSEIV